MAVGADHIALGDFRPRFLRVASSAGADVEQLYFVGAVVEFQGSVMSLVSAVNATLGQLVFPQLPDQPVMALCHVLAVAAVVAFVGLRLIPLFQKLTIWSELLEVVAAEDVAVLSGVAGLEGLACFRVQALPSLTNVGVHDCGFSCVMARD